MNNLINGIRPMFSRVATNDEDEDQITITLRGNSTVREDHLSKVDDTLE
jgi:hypothetical protein